MKKLKIVLTPSKPPLLARLTKEPGNWMFLGHHGWRWVPDRQKDRVLTRGIKARPHRPKFKRDYQVKARIGGWLSKPRLSVPDVFGNKRFVLGIALIAAIIGGVAIYQGPAFHSYIPVACNKSDFEIRNHLPCGDPTTVIWQATSPNSDLSEFNTLLAAFGTVTRDAVSHKSIELTPNSTFTGIALSKSSVDLSSVGGKNLWTEFTFSASAVPAQGVSWGWYLTTNSTLPLTQNYDPVVDKNVVLLEKYLNIGGGNTEQDIFFLRHLGSGDTISSENAGGCAPSSSCFLSQTYARDPTLHQVDGLSVLNFTALTNSQSGCVSPILGHGNGCSFLEEGGSLTFTSTQSLPWFSFEAQQFYIGVYARNTLGSTINWSFQPNCCMVLQLYIPVPTVTVAAPNIDTGGFFGPIIKALIGIGAFILQELVLVFTFVVSVVKLALDTIGGFVGLGAIGTALFSILAAAGNFISSVITTIGSQLANIVGFITSAASAIVAFLNSGSSFIWTQVTNFFNLWAVLFPLFNTIFLVFSAFSQNGVQLAQYALIFWWLYGIFVVLEQGTEKWWNHWVGMGEEAFKKVFNLGYWMVELSFHWLVWLKNLLAQWV